MRHPRCAIVASTAGSVMNVALGDPFFRKLIAGVVCDQPCAAATRAGEHGVPVQVFAEPDAEAFGQRLLAWLRDQQIDYVFSFYTQFYSLSVRQAYSDRIFNFHPSLLPAFKGMDGFGDGRRHGALFLGSTVELIDQAMDEGKIVLQTVFPHDPQAPIELARHRLFVQMCKSLLQVARWLAEDRIVVNGQHVTIRGARFDDAEFAPAVDDPAAKALDVPFPGAAALRQLGLAGAALNHPGTAAGALP
jgi:phosphoribosylglycinamide formyltransferase 1